MIAGYLHEISLLWETSASQSSEKTVEPPVVTIESRQNNTQNNIMTLIFRTENNPTHI